VATSPSPVELVVGSPTTEAPQAMPASPMIAGSFIVDAITKEVVAEIKQGSVYFLTTMSKLLTIRVDTVVPVSRVRFQWIANGKLFKHTERLLPYVMAGEDSGTFVPIPYLATDGIKMVAVDVFHRDNGTMQRKVLFFDMTENGSVNADATESTEMSLPSLVKKFLDNLGNRAG
jgi:hypothetical protein